MNFSFKSDLGQRGAQQTFRGLLEVSSTLATGEAEVTSRGRACCSSAAVKSHGRSFAKTPVRDLNIY